VGQVGSYQVVLVNPDCAESVVQVVATLEGVEVDISAEEVEPVVVQEEVGQAMHQVQYYQVNPMPDQGMGLLK
jgi:hypothetical protein